MIVVDTNVLAYHCISGPKSGLAVELRRSDSDWVVPSLWRSELLNVLSLYLRKQFLKLPQATSIFDYASCLVSEYDESKLPVETALALSQRTGCSSYDCEFVMLAKTLQLKLVTEDKQLLKKFPETAVSMQNYLTKH